MHRCLLLLAFAILFTQFSIYAEEAYTKKSMVKQSARSRRTERARKAQEETEAAKFERITLKPKARPLTARAYTSKPIAYPKDSKRKGLLTHSGTHTAQERA